MNMLTAAEAKHLAIASSNNDTNLKQILAIIEVRASEGYTNYISTGLLAYTRKKLLELGYDLRPADYNNIEITWE